MRLHFRLDSKERSGLRYIFLDVNHKYKRIYLSTKIAIPAKYWNAKQERLYPKAPNADVFNKRLEKMLVDANNVYGNCLIKGLPFEPEMIRTAIQTPDDSDAPITVQKAFDGYCDSQTKNGVRAASLTVYRTYFRHVQAFAEKEGFTLDFSKFDAEFFDNFLAYLRRKGFVDATVNKNLKGFKSFLAWCADKRGIAVNPAYKQRMVLNLKTESDHIALSEKDLTTLESLVTGKDTRLAKARDLFLIQCYTGLRYSDAVRLTEQHIQGNMIRIETVKTRQALTIPLHSNVVAILARNNGKAPKISNQKANEYLKEVCKRVGWTEMITRIEHRGAMRTEVTKPKYECIGTHTGRRTFVTIALRKGIMPESIRKATGHKDLKSFDKYVKMNDENIAQEFAEKWHEKLP